MRRLLAAASTAALLVPFAASSQAAYASTRSPTQTKESRHATPNHHKPNHHKLHGQMPVTGYFRGHDVRYLDLGPVALAKNTNGSFVSDVDPLWHVTNGPVRQRNIIDNVPGLNSPDDYTPLWQVVLVTWAPGRTPHLLKSAKDVAHEVAEGDVSLKSTNTVVNCPVLGYRQPVTRGFIRHQSVKYLDLGAIALETKADGSFVSDVDPLWHVTNGTGRQRNIIDNVPGLNSPNDYTPLWQVNLVTWRSGAVPRTLRGAGDVMKAMRHGLVTITRTTTVVNCPVL